MEYHRPVLLEPSIEGLKIQSSGIYIDATFGGGGHSKPILNRLDDKGHLFAFDRDEDASRNVWSDNRLTFIPANFRHLAAYMHYYGVQALDGVLADLGVSSHQFDKPERGFSYRQDHELDMRMNRKQELTAADVVNTYSEEQLVDVLSKYGEVRNSKTLASAICSARVSGPIQTVQMLQDVVEQHIMGPRMRYLSQVFQALRIEVNDEMGSLNEFMDSAIELLKPGGRIAIITYHSIEDRIVKYWMRSGTADGEIRKDEFGNQIKTIRPVNKKPIVPSAGEIRDNKRARSAKLRIAEKLKS